MNGRKKLQESSGPILNLLGYEKENGSGQRCAHSWAHGLEEVMIVESEVVAGKDETDDLCNILLQI